VQASGVKQLQKLLQEERGNISSSSDLHGYCGRFKFATTLRKVPCWATPLQILFTRARNQARALRLEQVSNPHGGIKMSNFYNALNKAVSSLERFTGRLDQGVDSFLGRIDFLGLWKALIKSLKAFDGWLDKFKIYKPTRRMLINFLKITQEVFKVILFLLAPTFILFYGLELRSTTSDWYYLALGWCLILIGILGVLMFVSWLITSFSNNSESRENQVSVNKGVISTVIISVDILAIGIIFGFVLLMPSHQFHQLPLKIIEDRISDLVYRQNVVQLAGVTNNADETIEFSLRYDESFHILAVGEFNVSTNEWVDYGWIEKIKNPETGEAEPIWTMRDSKGVFVDREPRNRKIDVVKELSAGQYRLRYRSDGSHYYNQCEDKGSTVRDRKCWRIMLSPK
jgi:hypothetical protein